MNRSTITLLALSGLVSGCTGPDPRSRDAGSGAQATITAAGIKSHTTFLGDDLLAGRGTGQPGYEIAARYVAAQFEAMGLEPGGTAGTYLQQVPLRESWLAPTPTVTVARRGRTERLVAGTDFVTSGDPGRTRSSFAGAVVFVGYGVSAPELGYDDYAGVDVRGKVVATFWGAPPKLPPNPRAHYSGAEKARAAADHGAAGMITLWSEDTERAFPWAFMKQMSRRTTMTWLDTTRNRPGDAPEMPTGVILSAAAARALFGRGSTDWSAALEAARRSEPRSVALPLEIRVDKTSGARDLEAPNVIGRLAGSDPELADEYVVFTAHLDHDGIGTAVAGDSIYNGVMDNAAGVAALIEIARAFVSSPDRPKRSLLFIATAAEEKGLLGAAYYAANPTVPIGAIVANLNMDGNHLLFPASSIVALGTEHSSLGAVAEQAAKAAGLELERELMPEQAFFVRSDQYPFVKKGVPALFFVNGTMASDSTVDGGATLGRWLTSVYHTPKDDLTQPMHFDSGARYAWVVYLAGRAVADAAQRPTWNPGDFFGVKFGRSGSREAQP